MDYSPSAWCWTGHRDAGTAEDDVDASKPIQLWSADGGLAAGIGANADDIRAGAVKGLDSQTAILRRHDLADASLIAAWALTNPRRRNLALEFT